MSVGAVLLQPERLARASAAEDSAVADVVAMARLVVDEARAGGPLSADIDAAFDALAGRLVASIESRVEAATGRLEALLGPLLTSLDRHIGTLGDAEDPDEIALALVGVLGAVTDALASLDPGGVESTVRTLVEVVEVDLGLSVEGVRAELLLFADDLVVRLETPRPDGDAETRRRAATLARLARRWRARVAALPVPALDADAIAREIADRLRGAGLDELLDRVRCVAVALGQALDAGASVAGAVGSAEPGGGTVGAAAAPPATDQHLWYLTWLLGNKQPWYAELLRAVAPWIPADEVWVDVAAGKVVRRDVFGAHVEVAASTDWTQAYALQSTADRDRLEALGLDAPYTFGRNDQVETLEQIAWVSAIVVHATESLLHLISLEEGDYATNAFAALDTAMLALHDGLVKAPMPWYVDTLIMRTLIPLFTSMEGMHTKVSFKNCFLMWLTLVGPDLGEGIAYRSVLVGLRDLVLSFLTLRNHEHPTTSGVRRPSNRLESAGFVAPFVSLFSWLNRLFVPKKSFGIENLGQGEVLLPWLMGAPIMGIFGSILGHVLTEHAIARAGDWAPFGGHMLKTVFKEWVMFVPSWYAGEDGDTGDGTYNPQGDDYPGYPDADSSPYRLPWTAGDSVYVGQGNQGFFSHFHNNNEVYAYDFSMDQDDDVLAARAGTVYDFRDNLSDDSENRDANGNARANFIRILHDQDGGPVDGHDRDENGAVTTYASYLHGRQGSVTAAFPGGITTILAARADPTLTPTTVTRGQVIMGAGDTGKSFHNHLHMEVHPDDGSGNPDRSITLPFVFREVGKRHEIRDLFGLLANPAGVPTRFNFYTSENE